MTDYTVKQGDCLSSIAHQFGFTWQRLWNDPANAELRALRKNPNILYPGDVVHVPTPSERSFALKANAWNRFVIDRGKAFVRLRLRLNGQPLDGLPYSIEVDGTKIDGLTSEDGAIEASVPSDSTSAVLRIGEGVVYKLRLGALDPIETATGLQSRLAQLGFYNGATDGVLGPISRAAVRLFQTSMGLEPSGEADAATVAALREQFGC